MQFVNIRPVSQFFLLLSLSPLGVKAATALPTVDCVILPSRSAELSAPVPGVVDNVHKALSDSVIKGELIAELNTGVEQAAVELAVARTNMLAERNAERANLEFYSLQLERIEQLSGNDLASPRDKDDAARLRDNSFWRIEQVSQSEAIRQKELLRAKAQLKNKRIYAPFDGVVAKQYKFPGEYIEGQPIVKVVDLNTLHIEAVFPMEHYAQLSTGMQGWVYPEVDQRTGYKATVDVIDPIGDVASGTFGVRLTLDNSQQKLPAGIKCYLQVEGASASQSDTRAQTGDGNPQDHDELSVFKLNKGNASG